MEISLLRKLGRESKDYLAITFGLMCYAFGWVAFMLPYQITDYILCHRNRDTDILFYYQCHIDGVCPENTWT